MLVREATTFLHEKAVPQLAESLPSLFEHPKNGMIHPIHEGNFRE